MTLGLFTISALLFAVVWWGPGWLLGEALGVRRLLLPAVAPVMSIGLLSSVGVLGHRVGMSWSPVPVIAAVLVVAGIVFGARVGLQRLRRPGVDAASTAPRGGAETGGAGTTTSLGADDSPDVLGGGQDDSQATSDGLLRGRNLLIVVAGLALGAVVGAYTWIKATADLSGINQDWDIPWHANMVRLIADSGLWDPGIAGNFAYFDTVIAEAPIRGYPIAFHAALALVWPFSGAAIPAFINVAVLLLVAAQLPISAVALTALITRHPVALAAAGAISTWFVGFPFDMLWRGPLIPLVAGLALIGPFALLATRGAVLRRWWWTFGVALGAVGLVAIHPSLAFVALPILVFWFLGLLVVEKGRVLGPFGFLVASGALAVIVGWPIITWMLGESNRVSDVVWAADTDIRGAIDNLLFFHHGTMPMAIGTAFAFLGAVAMLFRPRTWWYVGPVAVFAFLAAYTMGLDGTRFLWATAPFYDDQWRVFGIYVMLMIPLVGLGVWQVARAVVIDFAAVVARRRNGSPRRSEAPLGVASVPATAAAAAAVLGLAAVVAIPLFRENVARVSPSTVVAGPTLSAGEVRLMTEIADYVPEDATVLNDPCDGSVWMYALGDRMPMIRHFEVLPTNRQLLLWQNFTQLDVDPAVRDAAAQMGIEWVYVADGRIRDWDEPKPGLESLEDLPFLTLVAREENASLYRIDWAALPGGVEQLDTYRDNLLRQPGVPGVWENAEPDSIAPLGRIC